MFCKNCGTENLNESAFCRNCGSPLNEPVQEPVYSYAPDEKTSKGMGAAGIVIIILLSILLILAAVFIVYSITTDKKTDYTQEASTEFVEEGGEAIAENRDFEVNVDVNSKTAFSMSELDSVISSKTSSSNVAVAVIDYNKGEKYVTNNDDQYFVASGFYAPLYLVANETDNSTLISKANTMMTSMDNNAANYIISEIGGLEKLNTILADNAFVDTYFCRNFGDVNASNAGYENYTTADDSIDVLNYLYYNGGYTTMKAKLSDDGISVPGGVTIYAHRGKGIGGAYNLFAIVKAKNVDYAVSILTENTSNTAPSIITDILANVNSQLESIYND